MFRHLKFDDRINIQGFLNQGKSIRSIAGYLRKAPSTIHYEIEKHTIVRKGIGLVFCKKLRDGSRKFCNGCPRLLSGGCTYSKRIYDAVHAHKTESQTRHSHNTKIHFTDEELSLVNGIVSKGVMKGQSIEAIYHTNRDKIPCSCTTIRRWVENGLLDIKDIHLKRKKTYRKEYAYHRKKAAKKAILPIRAGRTMTDYKNYLESNPDDLVIQLDSVIGKKSDAQKCLTVMFVRYAFQQGILYPSGKGTDNIVKEDVSNVLKIIFREKPDLKVVLLADNGVEFDSIHLLEKEFPGKVKVFYARPYCSTDKSQCERNHGLFRYVLPKGNSFNGFTQNDFDKIFSHINSYVRRALNWKSPCDLFAEAFSQKVMNELGIHKIPAQEVNLRALN